MSWQGFLPKSSLIMAQLSELEPLHPQSHVIANFEEKFLTEGSLGAQLMIIGDVPTLEEIGAGRPFVGDAGALLDKMLLAMGLSRDCVFLTTLIESKVPTDPTEISNCFKWLLKQINIVNPKVIITFGAQPSQILLQSKLLLEELRGRFHPLANAASNPSETLDPNIVVMPTHHPSTLSTLGTLATTQAKKETWNDLQMVMKVLTG